MAIAEFAQFILRIFELASTATVAGLTGDYLYKTRHATAWSRKRFIYTEVAAGIGILFSVLYLFPLVHMFVTVPVDLALFVLLMVAFALLENPLHNFGCGNSFHWAGIGQNDFCSRMHANVAFCFMGSLFFLGSAFLGCYIHHSRRRRDAPAGSRWWNRV